MLDRSSILMLIAASALGTTALNPTSTSARDFGDGGTEIMDRLNKEINAGLADPRTKARLAEQGGTVIAGSPADYGKLIADETEKWAKVIKFAGIKVE